MNKKILSLFIGTFILSVSYAQQYKIALYGSSQNIAGTTISVDITNSDEIHVDLDVTNISGGTVESVAARRVIVVQSGWADQVCYGAGCYDTGSNNDWVMGDYFTMTNNQTAVANLKISPSAPNNALYRYYFGTTQDPFQDSVDVRVNNVLAVKELKKSLTMTVAPNPASDYLSIKSSGLETGTVKMVDVLGNVILNESFSGTKTINTSSFKNGVYFVLISGEGFTNINRKVVIRH